MAPYRVHPLNLTYITQQALLKAPRILKHWFGPTLEAMHLGPLSSKHAFLT